jgi:hypothetical protein
MQTKRCPKCGEVKFIDEFYKNKSKKDGFNWWCKNCNTKYRKNNLKKASEYVKKWQRNNLKKVKKSVRKWRKNNPEYNREYRRIHLAKIKTMIKKWKKNNPDKVNSSARKMYHECHKFNPFYRLNKNIRYKIWESLKGNKKDNHWEDLVGYTLQDLITHLEKQFKNGMTWQNMGKWHIDHKRPISSFNFNSYDDPEFKECWALGNLQPLWASENQSKGNRSI